MIRKLFANHFAQFLKYGDDSNAFVIDFDDVWKWIGFSKKDKAKDLLKKYFEENIHYTIALPQARERVYGGQNKEIIILNVDTFKKFCLKASTKRGDEVCDYYLKMEKIFMKYLREQMVKQKIEFANQKEHIKELEQNTEHERHNALKQSFKNKDVLYLTKLKNYDEHRFILKLGWSDNIDDRNRALSNNFGDSIFLNIFEVRNNITFESFLKRRPEIQRLRFEEEIQDVRSSETYLVTDDDYKMIIKIIKKNIGYYQGFNPSEYIEMKRLENEQKFLDLIANNSNNQSMIELLSKLQTNFNENIQDQSNQIKEDEEEIVSKLDQNNVPRNNTRNRKVQQYDKDSFELIKTYDGIMDVIRCNPLMSKYGIKAAANNNTIYHGYRWFFIEPSAEQIKYEIPQTVEIHHSSIPQFIAMLNKEKTQINNVFPSQAEAAKITGINRKQTINEAIKKDKLVHNHFFCFYEDCSEDLKNEYLSRAKLPNVALSKGTRVHQIDINTRKVIKTFESISEVLKEFYMSRAVLKRSCINQEAHKGFMWQFDENDE